MRTIKTALLGYGNIGGGVMKVLRENGETIAKHQHVRFEVVKALVRDLNKPRAIPLAPDVLTDRVDDIMNDPTVELVLEFMGGVHPASDYMLMALERGKTVVTANKEAIAQTWPVLEAAARRSGAGLYFEASVGGGIPVIRTLHSSMQANRMLSVMGIVNGTTNSILTQMSEEGLDYDTALQMAQEAGLAEPDPTNDVEAYDAMYKLSILASLAFHCRVPVEKIYREGITGVTPTMLQTGKRMGYVMKLLAIGKCNEANEIEVRVHPAFIPATHPLATVNGAYNAIFLEGNALGKAMLYGQGAGDLPTASAIVSDMVNAVNSRVHSYAAFDNEVGAESQVTFNDDWQTRYLMEVQLLDKPGVLGQVAAILGELGISLALVSQEAPRPNEAVPVVIVTHTTREKQMRKAVAAIEAMKETVGPVTMIRVEEE